MKQFVKKTFLSSIAIILSIAIMVCSQLFVSAASSSKGISVEKYNGKWAAVKNGKVVTSYTGVAKNQYGWWRVKNGYVDFDYTGIADNEYGWWRIEKGKVNFKATGVYNNEYGWWRVENGKVNFKATGIYSNQYGWWRVENGKVNFKANGVYKNEYGWWKVSKGKVDFNFTGIASNQYGSWYILDGKVDFTFTGKVYYNGTTYQVENGKATVYTPGQKKFDAETVKSQLTVTGYTYGSNYGDYGYCVLKIRNGSSFTINVSSEMTFSSNGKMVDTSSTSEYDIPAGHEFVLWGMSDASFDSVTYSLDVEETTYYKPVAQYLKITNKTISDDKVVFTVTNTGNEDVQFPEITALFFKNGQLIDTDFTYATIGDSVSLKAGASVNKDLSSYGTDFDSVELFATGRSEAVYNY